MGFDAALLTMAIASTAAAAAEGVASYQQAQAAEASAEYDAKLQQQNATLARQEAGAAEEMHRRRARVGLSNLRAATTERGLDLASSSAWDLYRQSAMDAEADALEIRRKGEMEARGLEARGAASRFAAGQARTAGRIGAGASLLSVGAAAASGYGDYSLFMAGRTPTTVPGQPRQLVGALR